MKPSIPFILFFLLAHALIADLPLVVRDTIPNADKVGQHRVTVLFWNVYDISLYAPAGIYSSDQPFALRLNYLRDLKGDQIAERSITEMRRQGIREVKLAAWFVQLKEIFPDVSAGDNLTGVFAPGQPTRFYSGNNLIGVVLDPDFGMPFSQIWLGNQSSRQDIRLALIGDRE